MLTLLTAVAKKERNLPVGRTQSGLARAKSEGKTLGRPSNNVPKLSPSTIRVKVLALWPSFTRYRGLTF